MSLDEVLFKFDLMVLHGGEGKEGSGLWEKDFWKVGFHESRQGEARGVHWGKALFFSSVERNCLRRSVLRQLNPKPSSPRAI